MCENSHTKSNGVCAFLGSRLRNMNAFPTTTTVFPSTRFEFPCHFRHRNAYGRHATLRSTSKNTPFRDPRYLRWLAGLIEIRYALRYRRANWRRIPARPVSGAESQCTGTWTEWTDANVREIDTYCIVSISSVGHRQTATERTTLQWQI